MGYPKTKAIMLKGKALADLKEQAAERDNYTCQECTKIGTDIHHIVFRSQGGQDILENLVVLCRRCHGLRHGIKYKMVETTPF